eukprot:226420-Rhodomonas_salina.2
MVLGSLITRTHLRCGSVSNCSSGRRPVCAEFRDGAVQVEGLFLGTEEEAAAVRQLPPATQELPK